MTDHPESTPGTAPHQPPAQQASQPWVPWPPMPYQQPPAQPEKRRPFARGFGLGAGFGTGLAVTLGVLSLVGGLLSMLILVAAAGSLSSGTGQAGTQTMQTIWGSDSAKGRLRAIPISGVIMAESADGLALSAGVYGYEVARVIDKLTEKDADGLVLLMNTPGGSINGSRAIADAVERYQERTKKPAVAYVQGMSASGGMDTMAGADEIVVDHGSLVGSIGVISGPFSRYRDVTAIGSTLLEPGVETSGGITQEYITQGRGKDMGDPFRDMTKEERAKWNSFMEAEYDNFVNWVSEHRGIPADTIKDDLGAFIYGTADAEKNKLIDATMGREEAFRHFAEKAGLDPDDTKVVQAVGPTLLEQLMGAESRAYGTAPAASAPAGQPVRVTSTLCTTGPQVLAYHGDPAAVCG